MATRHRTCLQLSPRSQMTASGAKLLLDKLGYMLKYEGRRQCEYRSDHFDRIPRELFPRF
jgi:hypothetical protein